MAASTKPEEEFAVTRDEFRSFFSPELPVSTFNDLVQRGMIVPLKGLKRYYQLNRSLLKLGMMPLKSLQELPNRQKVKTDDVTYLGLHLIFPEHVPFPLEFRRREITAAEQLSAIGLAKIYLEHAKNAGQLSTIQLARKFLAETTDDDPTSPEERISQTLDHVEAVETSTGGSSGQLMVSAILEALAMVEELERNPENGQKS